MQQTKNPFQRENAPGIVALALKRTSLRDLQLRGSRPGRDRHGQVRNNQAQESAATVQRFGERLTAQHAPTEKLEGADSDRRREEPEAFVPQLVNRKVVQRRVVAD